MDNQPWRQTGWQFQKHVYSDHAPTAIGEVVRYRTVTVNRDFKLFATEAAARKAAVEHYTRMKGMAQLVGDTKRERIADAALTLLK